MGGGQTGTISVMAGGNARLLRDRPETDRNGAETADRGLSPHPPVHADWGRRSSDVNAAKQSGGGRADAERRSRMEGRLQLSVWTEEGRGRSGWQNRSSQTACQRR